MNYFHFPLLSPHDWIVHGTLNILFLLLLLLFFRAYSKTPSSIICFIHCLRLLVYAEEAKDSRARL